MSVYQHKRSATATAAPTAGELQFGEIAVNTADGNAFTRLQDGSVFNLTTPLPSRILQGGATTGQVLQWNGTSWAAYTIPAVAPADITAGGAFTGQYLKWSGTAWTPTYFVPAPWELDTTYASVGDFIGFDGESYFPLQVAPSNLAQQSAAVGQCIAWSGSAWAPAARLTRSVDVQIFTSSDIWIKPAGALMVSVTISGGGAGGGFGDTTTGGLGGGAGEGITQTILADELAVEEYISIGSGGDGGIGAAAGGIPAATRAQKGSSSYFTFGEGSYIKVWSFGGGYGAAASIVLGGTSRQNQPIFATTQWGRGGITGAGGRGGYFSGGGGLGAIALNGAGTPGGDTDSFSVLDSGATRVIASGGGAAGGATGATGGNGADGTVSGNGFGTGAGGGGAPPNGSTTAKGGNGGNGIRGSGGGGGGRGGSTSAGSNGGNGGDGFAIITTVCYT